MAVLKRTFLVGLLALAACSGGPPPQLSATGAWIRTPPPGALAAGGFVTLANAGGTDALVGASSPIAGEVMVHRSFEEDGMAKMEHVPSLTIEAGSTVKLAPGGHHLMFVQLKGPLVAGDRVPVTLRFKRSGDKTVLFAVGSTPPGD